MFNINCNYPQILVKLQFYYVLEEAQDIFLKYYGAWLKKFLVWVFGGSTMIYNPIHQ